jgi:3-phosphoshikimate 1-carboxyvinyltransferase
LEAPFSGVIRPPGSKSQTIRAMVAAAMAEGRSHVYGALDSDDTRVMVGILRSLGVELDTSGDPWIVEGTGGHFRRPEAAIDAGDSGLSARISLMLAALVEGPTTVDGSPRMRQRPVAPVIEVLRSQGIEVDAPGGALPATVHGRARLWGAEIVVGPTPTSQAVTALLLVSPLADNPTSIRVNGLEGSYGYLDLTCEVMEAFGATPSRVITGFEIDNTGYRAADYSVPPDASAAVYPMVAAAITGSRVEIEGLHIDSSQPDMMVAHHLANMGCRLDEGSRGLVVEGPVSGLIGMEADMADAPDGALALAVACLFASGTSLLTGLHGLAHKESDRLAAISQAMERIGGRVEVGTSSIRVAGIEPRGGAIDPFGDHRMAMAMALCGLRVPGVTVVDPGVVAKTWPGYWEDMGALVSSISG